MKSSAPLAYAPGLEHHHPIMGTLGDPGVCLYREIDTSNQWVSSKLGILLQIQDKVLDVNISYSGILDLCTKNAFIFCVPVYVVDIFRLNHQKT